MIDTARCHQCKRQFPDHLIDTLFIGAGVGNPAIQKTVCPICALAITNKLHGVTRKRFAGPIANSMYNQAIKYLKEKKNVRD